MALTPNPFVTTPCVPKACDQSVSPRVEIVKRKSWKFGRTHERRKIATKPLSSDVRIASVYSRMTVMKTSSASKPFLRTSSQ
jgi:hypothetical protein